MVKKFLAFLFLLFTLNTYSQLNGKWENFYGDVYLTEIAETSNDLWFASGSLIRMDKKTKELTYYNGTNSNVDGYGIFDMITYEDKVWMAIKDEGLVCYDGNEWTVYDSENSNLPNNNITSIEVQSNGTIWLLAENEALVRFQNDEMTIFPLTSLNASYNENINLYITPNDQLLVYNLNQLFVYTADNFELILEFSSEERIKSLADDGFGKLYIGTNSEVIYIYEHNEIEYTLAEEITGITALKMIFFDGELYAMDNGKLLRLHGLEFEEIVLSPGMPFDNEYAWSMHGYGDQLLVGGFTSNIYFVENGSVEDQINISSTGILDYFTYAVDCAPDGSVWVGLNKHGISRYKDGEWESFHKGNTEVIYENRIVGFAFENDGTVWAGGNTGGPSFYKYKDDQWSVVTRNETGIDAVTEFLIHNDTLWAVGLSCELTIFDGNEWSEIPNTGDGNNCIDVDSNGNIWIASNDTIRCYTGDEVINYPKLEFSIYNIINDIAIGNNDEVWIATNAGITCLVGDEIIKYNTNNSGLFDNHTETIEVDNDGNVWFGGKTGISMFDGENWHNVDHHIIGRSAYLVYDFAFDQDNNVWLSSNVGVSRYLQEENLVAVKEYSLNEELIVYPIPTKDRLKIDTNDDFEALNAEIYDLTGRKVKDFSINKHQKFIEVNTLNPGVYILILSNYKEKRATRFIIE
jgi:ligand-binding sensor domain-containing protein